jgi:hypothetical protein
LGFFISKKEKIIVLIMIIFFIFPTSNIVAVKNNILNISAQNLAPSYDQLDQYQHEYTNIDSNTYLSHEIYYNNSENFQWAAQSFTPSLQIITRIRLWLYKINISCVLIISIREKLNGNDLVVMSIGADDVSPIINPTWIEIDFPDVELEISKEYYIIAKCYYGCRNNEDPTNCYGWICGENTQYENGESFLKTFNNDWLEHSINDFCFETYGCNNRPPKIPEISGPSNGNIGIEYEYSFITIDPDDDYVYYCIKWDETDGEVCIGPFESGETASAYFTWQKIGRYDVMVKSKDAEGAESDWASIEVSMPHVNNNVLNDFIFNNFPRIFKIFQFFNTLIFQGY